MAVVEEAAEVAAAAAAGEAAEERIAARLGHEANADDTSAENYWSC